MRAVGVNLREMSVLILWEKKILKNVLLLIGYLFRAQLFKANDIVS